MKIDQSSTSKTGSGKLLLLAILFTAFQLTGIILTTVSGVYDLSWILQSALMAVMCYLMYFSYRSHNKNVTKPMLGAALMLLLAYELNLGGYYLQYIGEVAKLYSGETAFALFATVEVLIFLVVAGINIMHYVINATHRSSPKKVGLNKALCISFMVLILIQCACFPFLDGTALAAAADCFGAFADVFALGIVICIENSMDEFRIAREKSAEAAEEAEQAEA